VSWAVLVITFSYKSSIVMAAKIPAKKRKVDQENRVFKEEWTDKYFFIERKNKAICLICSENVSVFKVGFILYSSVCFH
jgi:hypothetical protein